ncbi:chromobox protein homolog 1 [Drosophila innubila]|uniref:chromobox protein homolog 1 n=1 Tax=Drosophila innubila TaxID=198719 RepID=UPI00148D026F|nr:chromobox protein homolog 1 [Drosophila innubila]
MNSEDKHCLTPSEVGSDEDEEYFVEKIIHRRMHAGELEYLVKWKECSDEDNTWELAKNLNCPSLIDEFETQRQLKNMKRKAELVENALYQTKAKRLKIEAETVMSNAFDNGYEVEEILSAAKINGQILFLVKYLDLDQPETVSSKEAYAHVPQMVLKFYERHFRFRQHFLVKSSD